MESYTFGEILEKFLTILGGLSGIFTIVVGIARLFGKNLLAHWFNKDLETHKASLAQTTNEMQERLRVEYGAIYTRRLEVIEELHNRLIYLDNVHHTLNEIFEDKYKGEYSQKEIDEVRQYYTFEKEFNTYFDCNKIFLPKLLAKNVYTYYTAKMSTFNANVPWEIAEKIHKECGMDEDDLKEIKRLRQNVLDHSNNNIKNGHTLEDFFEEIEDCFRDILGVIKIDS